MTRRREERPPWQAIVVDDAADIEDRRLVTFLRMQPSQPPRAIGGSRKQHVRIGMLQAPEETDRLALIDHFAVAHDGDTVRHVGNHSEIVADEDESDVVLCHQPAQ